MNNHQVSGVIVSGMGAANKTVALQLPLYPEHVRVGLRDIYPGTINVLLDQPIIIRPVSYDLDTGGGKDKKIKWCKGWVAERFLFKGCFLTVDELNTTHTAWIYKATSSPHNIDPFRVEIIAPFIQGVRVGFRVNIEIEGLIEQMMAIVD